MFNYKETLEGMRRERASRQAEVEKLDRAIAALQALVGNAALARTKPRHSAQVRRRISQAQNKGRAKVNQAIAVNAKKIETVRPKISAQGLRNIIEAQKKRWAKVRAAGKVKVKAAAATK
jgi:2',3'-cyclic-nucleotide 2'-phosphodiesterase (5'-nucleotidase family)